MFDHIQFTGLATSTQFEYAQALAFFKQHASLTFKPGLNILLGPNGCGKSTVLKILGDSMCATQGGVSTLSEGAVQSGVNMIASFGSHRGPSDNHGVAVAHDGRPVVFCDPRQTVGVDGGHFDDDFFQEGMVELGRRGSTGQNSLDRLSTVMGILDGRVPFPEKVQVKIHREHVNDLWQQALDVLEKRFVASIPRGQPSLLLDEPEANFSLRWQARLWQRLAQPELADRFQLIVATHSPFALNIPHANYIEFEPGTRAEVESILHARFGSAPAPPAPPKRPQKAKAKTTPDASSASK